MKKILLGLIIGVAIALPVGVFADKVIQTPQANYIYDVGDGDIRVEVFDDAGSKCYVAYEYRGNNAARSKPSISCLEAKP